MNIKLFVVLSIPALITSCGATKLSSKEISEIDSGIKVMLQTYNQPLIGTILFDEQPVTQIIAVDGKKVESEIFRTDEKLAIDIGLHKVEVQCISRSGYDEREYTEVMELNLRPYHEYRIRCSFDSNFGQNGTYSGSFNVKEIRIK